MLHILPLYRRILRYLLLCVHLICCIFFRFIAVFSGLTPLCAPDMLHTFPFHRRILRAYFNVCA